MGVVLKNKKNKNYVGVFLGGGSSRREGRGEGGGRGVTGKGGGRREWWIFLNFF